MSAGARLRLSVRTPIGSVLEAEVTSIVAEDRDGWFGVRPGRADLIALLPPGLLLFTDAAGEGFVALAGGLLELRGEACRAMVGDAVVSRRLDAVADELERHLQRRRQAVEVRRDAIGELAREMLRRLAREVRHER